MIGRFGIIGNPLNHSISPLIFKGMFKILHLDFTYIPFELKEFEIESFIKSMKIKGFDGMNVTIPYKEIICNFLDELDEHAGKIKAVNTIFFKNGKTIGFNTDFYGFKRAIEEFKEKINVPLILGGGGAGRAVLYAISQLKCKKIFLMDRNPLRREKLIKDFKFITDLELIEWSESSFFRILEEIDFVVNCTPVGMKGIEPLKLFNLKSPLKGKIFMDLIYNPPLTPFLIEAKSLGAEIKNGLDMLIFQAMKSFEIWTGIKTKKTDWLKVYNSINQKLEEDND